MSAFVGPATINNMPKGKDAVLTCMKVTYRANGALDTDVSNIYAVGKSMMLIECPNCKDKKSSKPYVFDGPVNKGYGNAWDHYKRCVGDDNKLADNYNRRKAEQLAAAAAAQNGGDESTSTSSPSRQTSLPFSASGFVKSLYNWLALICLKGIAICNVDCKLMQSLVKHPEVKSSKTVIETMHELVIIVEEKIAMMMKKAPCGQLIFDGYSYSGQHLCGLFTLFMVPYNGVDER